MRLHDSVAQSPSAPAPIEPGKYADIGAVDGNPLSDLTVMEKVTFVMKGGEVHKSAAQQS